jgi:hypothetical protein
MKQDLPQDLLNDLLEANLTEIVEKTVDSGDSSGILKVDVNEDDNALIKALKIAINEANIDMKYIVNKLGCTSRDAYNMFYGISKKNRISIASLEKWCEVLGKEMIVEFK